jgi:hypothetical protein
VTDDADTGLPYGVDVSVVHWGVGAPPLHGAAEACAALVAAAVGMAGVAMGAIAGRLGGAALMRPCDSGIGTSDLVIHGWLRACRAVYRTAGSRCSNPRHRSMAAGEMSDHLDAGNDTVFSRHDVTGMNGR